MKLRKMEAGEQLTWSENNANIVPINKISKNP